MICIYVLFSIYDQTHRHIFNLERSYRQVNRRNNKMNFCNDDGVEDIRTTGDIDTYMEFNNTR